MTGGKRVRVFVAEYSPLIGEEFAEDRLCLRIVVLKGAYPANPVASGRRSDIIFTENLPAIGQQLTEHLL